MVLKTNLANLAQAAKAVGADVVGTAVVGAAVVGAGTGFYLYNGKRNAYEEDDMM